MITRERIGTEIGLLAKRVKRRIQNKKSSFSETKATLVERARKGTRRADYFIHDNAWKMIAISAGAAVVGGFFLAKQCLQAREQALRETPGDAPRRPKTKPALNSWEFIHSALPLALFVWRLSKSVKKERI